jgi:hypothetical protein
LDACYEIMDPGDETLAGGGGIELTISDALRNTTRQIQGFQRPRYWPGWANSESLIAPR